MSNKQMVSVPRDELEAACQRFAKAQIFDFSRRMRALLTQPAEQHQGEQVASVPVDRCYDVRAKMIIAFNEAKKAGADLDDCLDSAYKAALRFSPNPQTSDVAPAEIERLLEEVEKQRRLKMHVAENLQNALDNCSVYRAQLAEQHALLQLGLTMLNRGIVSYDDQIEYRRKLADLSASAEPQVKS